MHSSAVEQLALTSRRMFVLSLQEQTKDTSEKAPSASSTQTSSQMWPGLSSSVDGGRWQREPLPLLLCLITCVMEWFPPQQSRCATLCQGQCGHTELPTLTCLTFFCLSCQIRLMLKQQQPESILFLSSDYFVVHFFVFALLMVCACCH